MMIMIMMMKNPFFSSNNTHTQIHKYLHENDKGVLYRGIMNDVVLVIIQNIINKQVCR